MSTTLSSLLERLRAFGNGKLEALDSLAEENKSWLAEAVKEVAEQIASLAPATKKQRLDGKGGSRATAAADAAEQVRGGGDSRLSGAAVTACPLLHAALANSANRSSLACHKNSELRLCRRLNQHALERGGARWRRLLLPSSRRMRTLSRSRMLSRQSRNQPSQQLEAAGVASSSSRQSRRRVSCSHVLCSRCLAPGCLPALCPAR